MVALELEGLAAQGLNILLRKGLYAIHGQHGCLRPLQQSLLNSKIVLAVFRGEVDIRWAVDGVIVPIHIPGKAGYTAGVYGAQMILKLRLAPLVDPEQPAAVIAVVVRGVIVGKVERFAILRRLLQNYLVGVFRGDLGECFPYCRGAFFRCQDIAGFLRKFHRPGKGDHILPGELFGIEAQQDAGIVSGLSQKYVPVGGGSL